MGFSDGLRRRRRCDDGRVDERGRTLSRRGPLLRRAAVAAVTVSLGEFFLYVCGRRKRCGRWSVDIRSGYDTSPRRSCDVGVPNDGKTCAQQADDHQVARSRDTSWIKCWRPPADEDGFGCTESRSSSAPDIGSVLQAQAVGRHPTVKTPHGRSIFTARSRRPSTYPTMPSGRDWRGGWESNPRRRDYERAPGRSGWWRSVPLNCGYVRP